MSLLPNERPLEIGVDYITATTHLRRSNTGLGAFGHFLVAEEVRKGERGGPWRFSGYRGLHAGSVSYGRRPDGEIVRASSAVASEHWQQILSLATNCSRFDIQLTAPVGCPPHERLEMHLDELRTAYRKRGRPAQIDFWGKAHGLTGVASGSRVSDRYLRIYDKFFQSEEERYFGCLRYEVEFKNKCAFYEARALDEVPDYRPQIAGKIIALATARGLSLPGSWASAPLASVENVGVCSPDPSQALLRRAYFAATCVKGLLPYYADSGKIGELVEILGLGDYVMVRPIVTGDPKSERSVEWED